MHSFRIIHMTSMTSVHRPQYSRTLYRNSTTTTKQKLRRISKICTLTFSSRFSPPQKFLIRSHWDIGTRHFVPVRLFVSSTHFSSVPKRRFAHLPHSHMYKKVEQPVGATVNRKRAIHSRIPLKFTPNLALKCVKYCRGVRGMLHKGGYCCELFLALPSSQSIQQIVNKQHISPTLHSDDSAFAHIFHSCFLGHSIS